MIDFLKRAVKAVWRRVDPSHQGRVRRIMKRPPAIRKNHIVFTSSGDYSGNPKALFLYMMEHGYGDKYEFTWLFENRDNMEAFNIPGVNKALIWDEKGIRTPKAQKAIMSAGYIFYSHNVNWARTYSPEQTYVNLWHGCGYKGNMRSDKRKIYYDYVIVTGQKYIEVFKEHLKNPDGNILDLGYPRNEMLFTDRTCSKELAERLKAEAAADKLVIWLPTYRKSKVARLDTDTSIGETGLPILYTEADIIKLDEKCKERGILIVLKQHMLASALNSSLKDLTNIIMINDAYLQEHNADLYEFLGASDALLTDYSSAAIDYLLLDKPIGYTLDDFEEYEEQRGWCLDNVKSYMPGHHIYNMNDLFDYIDDVSEGNDIHKERRVEVRPELHTYTEGYSRRILDYFNL